MRTKNVREKMRFLINALILIFSINVMAEAPKEGVSMSYYDSGSLRIKVNYKNGLREGKAKYYYESGTLMFEASFKNNQKDGITQIYSKDGLLIKRYNYVNDKLVGSWER